MIATTVVKRQVCSKEENFPITPGCLRELQLKTMVEGYDLREEYICPGALKC